MTVKNDVEAEENLGRGIFSSKYAKRAQSGIMPYNVFLHRKGVACLSVDRLNKTTLTKATDIADSNATLRDGNFYGWAVITVEKAQESGRAVQATPRPNNPFHADIVLPDSAIESWDEQKSHAHELAEEASWRERDSR